MTVNLSLPEMSASCLKHSGITVGRRGVKSVWRKEGPEGEGRNVRSGHWWDICGTVEEVVKEESRRLCPVETVG